MNRVVLVVLLALGCNSSQTAKALSVGESEVTCWSGGQVVYHGWSSGVVEPEATGSGYFFREKGSGSFIRVSGACLFRN
jgi:hypothetical protein